MLSRVWLCDPRDCSPPGSSVHGILQARILEWVAISSSRGSSQLKDQPASPALLHWQVDSSALSHPGNHLAKFSEVPWLSRNTFLKILNLFFSDLQRCFFVFSPNPRISFCTIFMCFELKSASLGWRRKCPPTPAFLSGEFHGQRSLAGYSPWVHRVRHDWATNTFTFSPSSWQEKMRRELLLKVGTNRCPVLTW